MLEQEGVIKYRLNHSFASLSNSQADYEALNAWRRIMFQLELIGQNPDRYDGYGFGNISQRTLENPQQFLITGTQTGHLPYLHRQHYCLVQTTDLENNTITSTGPCKPSSEALTHAAVYQSDNTIGSVIHVHNPEIWRQAERLKLPQTSMSTPYGTLEMALEVGELITSGRIFDGCLFTMPGHQDGVVAFGTTLQQAAQELIKFLALALAIEPNE